MPIPVAQAGPDQSFAYSASAVTVTLAGDATNPAITSWKWTMLSVPSGSSANSGANQDFTDGVATVQNPQFDMDVPGCYVLQLEAENASGWSIPIADKAGGQTLCFMRTQSLDLPIPGYQSFRYDSYLNTTLLALETAAATTGGQTNTVAGANGITNTGDNVDATLAPTYGSSANTICQGNDARLSDARAPTSHASSHQSGGGDAIKLDDLATPDDNTDLNTTIGAHGLCPKLGGGTTNYLRADGAWAAPPGGGGQTDTVVGSNGITNVGDNVDANLSPTYGAAANTVCQGNDSRLSDARAPTSHAASHQSGGGDAIKLDDLSAPDDNTDLDSTISAHGLLPKLGGGTTNFLRADGTWAAPAGGTGSPLTTKGDVWGYDTGDARVPVGTNGHVLQADSAQALGVKYAEVANASLADMAQATIKGRASGAGTGDPTDLTAAQATAILDAFTDALKGLAPASGGGTTNFLRADGTWAAPPGGGSSPLTTKGDVWGFSTVDARIPVGTNGQVLTADSAEALGVKWATAGGGGFTAYEQEFTAVAGANEFTLSATPAVNANTMSGRNILGVFRNGVRLRWRATVTLSNEYNQTGGTDKINVVAQAGGEIIIVVYGV